MEFTPLHKSLGAKVENLDCNADLSHQAIALQAALAKWQVLLFRGQALQDKAFSDFCRLFGELELPYAYSRAANPGKLVEMSAEELARVPDTVHPLVRQHADGRVRPIWADMCRICRAKRSPRVEPAYGPWNNN
ncbi:MAG: hypothetical protein HOI95_11550 [Chromatiales bacterium]|jgi:alpha-ketoglutarate-dependent taurine dioxygenase|nr:hypothetical protein [Chromatiales bacterium]